MYFKNYRILKSGHLSVLISVAASSDFAILVLDIEAGKYGQVETYSTKFS